MPAAITHGAFKAFAVLPAMLVAPGHGLGLVLVGLIGWPAAVLFGLLAVLLLSGSWAGRTGAEQGVLSCGLGIGRRLVLLAKGRVEFADGWPL